MTPKNPPSFLMDAALVFRRGFRRQCPQCGSASLLKSWYEMADRCVVCDLDFLNDISDHWAFMYFSTAFLTGFVIIGMLWVTPTNLWVGRVVVLLVALGLWLGTYPVRKSLAVAFLYLTDLKFNNHDRFSLRRPDV